MEQLFTYDKIFDVFYYLFLIFKEFWYLFLPAFLISIIVKKIPKFIKHFKKRKEYLAEVKKEKEMGKKLSFKPNNDIEEKLREVDQMDGEQFETFLRYIFKDLGYYTEKTAKVGDYGADLILLKDGFKIAVQAKIYRTKKVNLRAVQEVHASLKRYVCDKGIVITNNYFTQSAKNLANDTGVELWDRDKLSEVMLSLKKVS